jgi:hypothetical protein
MPSLWRVSVLQAGEGRPAADTGAHGQRAGETGRDNQRAPFLFRLRRDVSVRVELARWGPIDLRGQSKLPSALRTDTRPQVSRKANQAQEAIGE